MSTFAEQLGQSLNVSTVNYFDGVFTKEAGTAAPPKDSFDPTRPGDYKKTFQKEPVLFWGPQNNFPNLIEEEAQLSSVFEGGMKVLCDHLRGQDFFLFIEKYENGKRIVEEVQDDEVMAMLYDIGYYEYWYDACFELPKWGNGWPMYFLNGKKEISNIRIYDSMSNRFERPSLKTGRIENLYTSSQWGNGIHKSIIGGEPIPANLKGWVKKTPLLDRYDYVDEMEIMAGKGTRAFASHHKFSTSGSKYGRAPWHSLYANRWLGISGKVPEMMMRYYEAAMTINYLIYMNQEWLEKKLPQYNEWTDEQKAEKIAELQKAYEKNLKGSGNAFKSLMLTFNVKDGKEIKNVMFDTIDNKLREGKFIPDSQVSDGQVLFTLALPPALLGAVIPGAKGGEGGSGSNIREASLAMQMRMRPDRELAHSAFYIWRDYTFRKLKPTDRKRKVKIGTRDYIINTLDGRAPAAAQETTAV